MNTTKRNSILKSKWFVAFIIAMTSVVIGANIIGFIRGTNSIVGFTLSILSTLAGWFAYLGAKSAEKNR